MVGYSDPENRWVVYSVPECEPLSGFPTRDEAVGAALAEVTRGGGWLTVHFSDGAIESQQQYAAAERSAGSADSAGSAYLHDYLPGDLSTETADGAGVARTVRRRTVQAEAPPSGGLVVSPSPLASLGSSSVENGLVSFTEQRSRSMPDDRGLLLAEDHVASLVADLELDPPETVVSRLDQGLDLLGVLGLFGMPLVTGVYSLEILAATQGGTLILYSVSLTWALGFALLAVALSSGLRQARLGELVAAFLCFVLSGYIAGEIGVGGFAAAVAESGSMFESMGGMLASAVHAYGPGGAVATAAIGVFFGWRIARRLPGSRLNARGA